MKFYPITFVEFYQVVGCINSILKESVNDNTVIVQYGLNAPLDFPVILRNYQATTNVPNRSSYDFYVADLRTEIIGKFLKDLLKYESSNPSAKYIFIVDKMIQGQDVADLLENYFLNFVLLEFNTQDIFTVFPYEDRSFQDISTALQKIGRCQDRTLHLLESYRSLFPDKVPTVWNRAELTLIYSYEAPYSMDTKGHKKGIEIDLLELIFERIGIDAYYVNIKDEVSVQIFILIDKGQFDIRLGNIALGPNMSEDFTVPYTCDSTYWYVPQPKAIPKWKLALSVFSLEVNLAILLTVICMCIIWEVVQVLMEDKKLGRSFLNIYWSIITIYLEQEVTLKMDYVTLKILVFLLLQSLLILNSLFKAKYTFFLSGTNYEKTIETLEEAMEAGLKIGSTKFLIRAYFTAPELKDYIERNFVECDTGPACMNRSALERDLAVLKPYKKVAYIMDLFTDDHGHYLHHRLLAPVLTICNSFYFPKGHPMHRLIDRYVHFLLQHGFVQKVIAKYDQPISKRYRSMTSRNPRLQFDAVVAPVFVVVIGSFVGLVVFVAEKLIYTRMKRN